MNRDAKREPAPSAQETRAASRVTRNCRLTRHRFFLTYAYDTLTHTSLWLQWKGLLAHVRRIRTVALVLRVLTFLLSILQTGALVLLATALFLIIIPVGSALMLGILLTALIESRHTNRRLRSTLSNRRACVLFLAANTQNGFLWQNALDLSARGYTVFLISPYWISGQSPVSKKYYVTARTLSPNVYLIRRYYFFSLRRHVLKDRETAYVY